MCTRSLVLLLSLLWTLSSAAEISPQSLYEDLRSFRMAPGAYRVQDYVLDRDRLHIKVSGVFYFPAPVNGRIYGAVFQGQGSVQVSPWSDFERGSVKRFLRSDSVNATFTRAVMRFTDDTYDALMKAAQPAGDATVNFEYDLENRLATQTGLNLSSRLTLAILLNEQPGVFFAEFDGGNRGRFAAVLDHQGRALDFGFGLNAGEKGLLFKYNDSITGNDVWTAFYDATDFQHRTVSYSDVYDLVDTPEYRMEIDLLAPGKSVAFKTEMDLVFRRSGVQIVPFRLSEGLDEYDKERLKKGIRILSAKLADGSPLGIIHHEWESSFSLIFPKPMTQGEKATIKLELEAPHGFMESVESDFFYPLTTTTWYPRHGSLATSIFKLKFHHKEGTSVVSVGERACETSAPNSKDLMTCWDTKVPVRFASFVVGKFERHTSKCQVGSHEVALEVFLIPGSYRQKYYKRDSILADLSNTVRYFSTLFSDYPFSRIAVVDFPRDFGQGLPTMLLLPNGNRFLSHEVAHQWWGNSVGWRSYRDQWLSEGFAEYSDVLFSASSHFSATGNTKNTLGGIKYMRAELQLQQQTETGIVKEKVYDIGPLTLGHRLSSRHTLGGYNSLIYNKGSLVLRMLQFLLTDSKTGDDVGFTTMMEYFVKQHQGESATTEAFFAVASEHFAKSPIGRQIGSKNLDWFIRQWVYGTGLPSYRLVYTFAPAENGKVIVSGTLYQDNVDKDWFMPIPVRFDFEDKQSANAVLYANGPETQFKLLLPKQPQDVKLDPYLWVLTERTSAQQQK